MRRRSTTIGLSGAANSSDGLRLIAAAGLRPPRRQRSVATSPAPVAATADSSTAAAPRIASAESPAGMAHGRPPSAALRQRLQALFLAATGGGTAARLLQCAQPSRPPPRARGGEPEALLADRRLSRTADDPLERRRYSAKALAIEGTSLSALSLAKAGFGKTSSWAAVVGPRD